MTSVGKTKPKKWISTAAIDAAITRIYVEEYDRRLRTLPTLRAYARHIGWPSWAVRNRGRQLGLARTKEAPWSEAELELLEQYSWMTPPRIFLKLKAAGFRRTVTSIHLKLRRTRYKQHGDYYSSRSLAGVLGIDSHVITRWIDKGWLKAERRGTERTPQQGGDMWLIHEDDVRRFIVEHPDELTLRKITDQRWFLYLITKGEVAA